MNKDIPRYIRRSIIALAFVLCILPYPNQAQQKYTDDWQTLRERPYPEWFKEAKLGIFIHWGLYSVPAYSAKNSYSEWFLKGLQSGDSTRTTFMKKAYGDNFIYNDFAPLFKAELFDAAQWAELFKASGARYVVMVSKHHDGYCLWPSKYARNWNSVEVGPKRDIVGELTHAVKSEGLKMGLYYSLPEWNHPLHRWDTDPHRNIGNYVEQHMIPQFKELVSTYKPSLIFADGEWFNTAEEWHSAELISWYYNLLGEEAVVNNRWGSGSDIGFLTPEYSAGLEAMERPWAEVRSLSRSFGLNRNEGLNDYMSPRELIHFFATTVANGGGLILNVGPGADGMIPLLQQERLLQLGEWLKINGEAIYGAEMNSKTSEKYEAKLSRVEANISFDLVRDTPGHPVKEDNFTAVWQGYIEPEYSETYSFSAEADDAIKVWVDGKLVVDTEADNAYPIKLKAGKRYAFKAQYHESTHDASARLFWASKSQGKEVIPSDRFYQSDQGDEHGLAATYSSERERLLYTRNHNNLYAIALGWPESELALKLPEPKPNTKISLLGREGYLPWQYDQETLTIDVSEVGYNDIPGKYAWTFKIEDYQ
ncbi:hypothetical protein GCM10009122_05680 [Fulvivirga kasyanovii]|uniref:alpha-L-fucosidase n=1 Tax=Fulvivirga kasyanovii TaxID=396812 RepID=A0ABW9RWL6_9BACT|nr:alpha-L-fucosidase [Fulvivirga kasyanovii]MTI28077.1 hypothetical protein [Fulvivirga kasyanovii]